MTVIRADAVAGRLSADMTTGSTTMSSAGLADLPVVASPDIAKVVLYQADTNGRVTKKEIVYVTAHSSAATSATITRAQEGTTAQAWSGTTTPSAWVHAPTAADFTPAPVRTILKTLHSTYGDDFTASSLDAKWTRGGNAASGQESFQVDSDAASPTWMRWDRRSVATGGYLYQTAPAGDFSVVVRWASSATTAAMAGPVIVNTAGDGAGATFYTSPQSYLVTSLTAMAYASNFAQGVATQLDGFSAKPCWLKLRKSGTSYFASASFDGEKWLPETTALTSSITVARIGVGHWFANGNLNDIDVFNVV